MKMRFRLLFSLMMISSFAGAAPPQEVLEKVSEAQNALDSRSFRGSYKMSIDSVISKENGSSKKTSKMEIEVEVDAGARERRHLLRFISNGEDESEKHRQEIEAESKDAEKGDDEQEEDFLLPTKSTQERFKFGIPVKEAGRVVVEFQPARGHEKDEGICRGRLAWEEESLDPLWIEAEVIKPPKPMRECHLRMKFERVGDLLVMHRMSTEGRVKILLMKRKFHMEMRFEEIKVAAGSPGLDVTPLHPSAGDFAPNAG